MLNRFHVGLGLTAFLAIAAVAFADIAQPKRSRSAIAKLDIRANRSTTKNQLIIPKKLLKSARTVASLDAGQQDGNHTRTILAGIALSLASVSLVFVFIRRKSAAAKTTAALLVGAAATLFAYQTASADVAPPRADVVRDWKRAHSQDVEIVITEKGNQVVLVLGTYKRGGGRPRPEPPKTGAAQPGK